MSHLISLHNLFENPSFMTRVLIWVLDRLLGISKMNQLYQMHQMQGLSKDMFADKLLELLKLNIHGLDDFKAKIPRNGPVVIASNHPYGGIEGVILARAISEVRPDVKVLANQGLGIFRELSDFFIFTNPLSQKDPKNGPSLRRCIQHVQDQHALLIFPAGKVSYYQAHKGTIGEHTWNKIVARLLSIDQCQYVPVFVSGQNSKIFYRVERIWFQLRMLLLGRELLNKTGAEIHIDSGFPISNTLLKTASQEQTAAFARVLSYAQDRRWRYQWPADKFTGYSALAEPVATSVILEELHHLPEQQLLTCFSGFKVYYAYQHQAPQIVHEITRLRESVFRLHNEGSGKPVDSDKFDASYVHLFIIEMTSVRMIGAYRLGLSDKLIEALGVQGLYLNNMFEFRAEFVNRKQPAIEMGRSFLIPEFQGSYQGLLLLWRGIGAFLCQFPQYRTLYGTVSISKLYDARSVNFIQHCLITPHHKQNVTARNRFTFEMHPEVAEFCQQYLHPLDEVGSRTQYVSAFLKSLEHDGKDIPILAKQYLKMGAHFHALGIDTRFNHTPGLLLSVDITKAPTKLLKLYMGENFYKYQKLINL